MGNTKAISALRGMLKRAGNPFAWKEYDAYQEVVEAAKWVINGAVPAWVEASPAHKTLKAKLDALEEEGG